MALEAGTPAPDFSALTDGSAEFTLSSLRGKYIVLYFYPKDDTSGCTKEACSFRDSMERITAYNAAVIGVSPDSPAKHASFIKKYDLNFTLVSDEDKSICQQYGVWAEKSMYGRKYMGVERTTYIINPEGVIIHVFPKVKVPGHADEVIKILTSATSAL
jgi:peroxiredoxin Q/BCP